VRQRMKASSLLQSPVVNITINRGLLFLAESLSPTSGFSLE
jgi:hypothetical protein